MINFYSHKHHEGILICVVQLIVASLHVWFQTLRYCRVFDLILFVILHRVRKKIRD